MTPATPSARVFLLPLMFVITVLLVACSEQTPVIIPEPDVSAADVVSQNRQLSELDRSLSSEQRQTLASPTSELTLFAPIDAAFEDVDTLSRAQMSRVIDYHMVLGQQLTTRDLRDKAGETLTGTSIKVLEQDGILRLQGAGNDSPVTVISQEPTTTNGSVFLIDGLLLPATTSEPPDATTVLARLQATPETQLFAEAAVVTGLDITLTAAGSLTGFVPDDAAFEALIDSLPDVPADVTGVDALLDGLGEAGLKRLLETHLIIGANLTEFDLEGFADAGAPLPASASGRQLSIGMSDEGELMLEGYATLSRTDDGADNGLIHVLDSVLQDAPPAAGEAVVEGLVFDDINQNEVRDDGESGLAEVEVVAFVDANDNGIRDASEVEFSTLTDSAGRYQFTGLDALATYTITQKLPFGWRSVVADGSQTDIAAQANKVVGGGSLQQGDYPFMVSLQFERAEGGFEHYCGASLISSSWLLTAAHCAPREDEVAYLGSVHLRQNPDDDQGIIIPFDQVIIHPRYQQERSGFDVALVSLAEPVTLPTVPLASAAPSVSHAYVVGWGDLSSGGGSLPDVLHEVDVPLMAREDCLQLYQDNAPSIYEDIDNVDTQRCAGRLSGNVDACQGDSGGPLLVRNPAGTGWVQLGISSWGVGCGFAGLPGVYANVPALADWIYDNARETSVRQLVDIADRTRVQGINFANTSTLNPQQDNGQVALIRDFQASANFPDQAILEDDIRFSWQVESGRDRLLICTLDANGDGEDDITQRPCEGLHNVTYRYAEVGLYRATLTVIGDDMRRSRTLLVNATDLPELRRGASLEGSLTANDSTSSTRPGSFSDYVVMDVSDLGEGSTLRITLTSTDFEPVLYALDERWRALENSLDNTSGDNHAELVLAGPLPADRLIIAITSEEVGVVGNYALVSSRVSSAVEP
ncbi:MAG: trypsin-like serine protease [Deinococcota bacterium]